MIVLLHIITRHHLPKSSVIPLSLLCGFLSKDAVEATELNALAK